MLLPVCLCPRGKGSVRRAPASRAALGCSAFLQQQQQARSCSAHVFRWAEAFKGSAPLLLFPGQTQPGISALKRTLRAMKVSSPSILHPSQVLVHLTGAFKLPLPISQPALSSFPGAFLWHSQRRVGEHPLCSTRILCEQLYSLTLPWKSFLPRPVANCPPHP